MNPNENTLNMNPNAAADNAHQGIDQAANKAETVVDRMAQNAHAVVDKVAAKGAPAMDQVKSSAAGANEALRAKAEELGEMQSEWTECCRDYIRERPLTAIGIAVLAGMLLSRWGR